MLNIRTIYWIAMLGAVFATSALLLHVQKTHKSLAGKERDLFTYSYQGPTSPVPGNSGLIRVQVLVRDSPEAGGVQIQSAEFDGRTIPLKPRDIYGNRGSAGFQVPPGKYKLKWVAQKDRLVWPRLLRHEEIVEISPRDLWLQIEIVGNDASIR